MLKLVELDPNHHTKFKLLYCCCLLLLLFVLFVVVASEENASIPDVGVDAMLKDGRLERYKNGPIYWIDSADNNPCVGNVYFVYCCLFIVVVFVRYCFSCHVEVTR